MAAMVLSLLLPCAAHAAYTISIINRSLTSAPLLAFPTTSFAQNTLNPSWLPLPDNPGGGLFFRVLAPFAGVPGDPYVRPPVTAFDRQPSNSAHFPQCLADFCC